MGKKYRKRGAAFLAAVLLAAGLFVQPEFVRADEIILEEAGELTGAGTAGEELILSEETQLPVLDFSVPETETGNTEDTENTETENTETEGLLQAGQPEAAGETETGPESAPAAELPAFETDGFLESVVVAESPDGAEGTGIYYILGRPMTEEEIAAQAALEPDPGVPVVWDIPEPGVVSTGDVSIPSAYDARRSGYVTKVKDQTDTNNCWSYAAISAAETSMIKNGAYLNGTVRATAANTDLSEQQLAYYTYNQSTDALGNTRGDRSGSYESDDYRFTGGWGWHAAQQLANGFGAAADTVNSHYLYRSSVSVSQNTRAALLRNFYRVASDSVSVKNAVYKYGSVTAMIAAPESGSLNYNASTGACYNRYAGTNHEVTIVGWNDRYSRYNFHSGQRPSGDGAFIAKNSWGTGWADEGYFYISYYDASLSGVIAYDMISGNAYQNIYQYDGTAISTYRTVSAGNKIANVYTVKAAGSEKTESLRAVGFDTGKTNMSYQIQIYRNPSSSNPESGTPLLSSPVRGTVGYEGWHTVSLGQTVTLNPGSSFSVVVTFTNAGSFAVEEDINDPYAYWYYNNAATAKGQSFLYTGGSWRDLHTAYGECARLKAYTDNGGADPTRDFVRRMYTLVLGRTADSSGLDYWCSQLNTGKLSGSGLVYQMLNSPEFQSRRVSDREYVNILYQAVMGREADSAGRDYWLKQLDTGFSRRFVLVGFLNSAEFRSLCSRYGIVKGQLKVTEYRDMKPQVTQFVARCYEKALGRKGDASGLNYWCRMLITKKSTAKTVARQFVFSREVTGKRLSDRAFLKVCYQVCLGRNPDAPGQSYWLGQLKRKSRATVYNAIAASKEFTAIIKSFGL